MTRIKPPVCSTDLQGYHLSSLELTGEGVLSHRPKRQSGGGIQHSTFASSGRSLLPWLGAGTKEVMTGVVPLALEHVESATEPGAAQQRSLDSLAKLLPDNRRALDSLSAEQGGVCIVATTTAHWDPHSGEGETQLADLLVQESL